jgi:hypothetical protein
MNIMKKLIFLIPLMVFCAIQIMGQNPTLKTNPAMDSKNEVNISKENANQNNGVVAYLENSVAGQTYYLVQVSPEGGITETITGNGSKVEFSKLSFPTKRVTSYMVQTTDFTVIGTFTVNTMDKIEAEKIQKQ